MADTDPEEIGYLLQAKQAELLSSSHKSPPFWGGKTPRWICQAFLATKACIPVKGGIYRINQANEGFFNAPLAEENYLDSPLTGTTSVSETVFMNEMKDNFAHPPGEQLNTGFSAYREKPREIKLEIIQTVLKVHTRIPELYSDNHNQLEQQMILAAEYIYETKENLLFNHRDFGMLNQCAPSLKSDKERPLTLDVLDNLLHTIWKRPDFFVMHPVALMVLHKEATRQGITLESCEMFGSVFTMWRGLPILPSNKLYLRYCTGKQKEVMSLHTLDRPDACMTTNVLLLRMGEAKQGVVSLYAEGTEGSQRFPLVKIDFMGIDDNSVASYLMTMYAGIALTTPGCLAVQKVIV